MSEPSPALTEQLLHHQGAIDRRTSRTLLGLLIVVGLLAAILTSSTCIHGRGGHQVQDITMAWRHMQRTRADQISQPAMAPHAWVQHFVRPRAGIVAADGATATIAAKPSPPTQQHGELKGALPPGDPRVRDAALLGTNEYSQDDWRKAVKQLTPHEEFKYACRVEGTIPPELDGTLFRNGPGKYERGGLPYDHFLDGDGLVVSFDLDSSSNTAVARARFVRTQEFAEEEAAGTILYRGTFGTRKPGGLVRNAFDLRTKNLANTNAVFWGGRLHALYEAGVPYELDPKSLATICADDMEECLPRTEGIFVSTSVDAIDVAGGLGGWAFTAHPHVDPHTERLCGWAWQRQAALNSITLRFAEWNADWKRVATRPYELKDCNSAPHDFGVTASKYVMVENRLDIDIAPYVLGFKAAANALISRPDLPVLVHVIPRAEDAPAFVFEGPRESFEIHVPFAHDGMPIGSEPDPDADAHVVTMYTAGWDRLAEGSFLSEWGTEGDLAPDFNNIPRTVLWRYVIDTRTGNVTRTLAPGCENLCIDHPHINPRFEGKAAARYVYATITNEASTSGPPRGYVRLDLLKGTREVWYAPSGRVFVEEPVIVEKASAREKSDDSGEVWVLGMSTDVDNDGKSSLLVLDGSRLAEGPVLRVHLDHHITHGLHGSFAHGFHADSLHN